jgi:hypothetical protein
MGIASDEHVRRWRDDGWVLVPELVPRDEIDAALEDLFLLVPRPEEYHAGLGDERRATLATSRSVAHTTATRVEPGGPPRFRPEQFAGRVHFPFPGSGALNRLAVHPNVVDFVERALGSVELRVYQMSVWAKYTGMADYAQPLHQDHNHSIVPPRCEPGWWHVEGFLYLSDVDDGVAPTHAVSVRDSAGRMQIAPLSPDDAPELYEAAVAAAGPKGSYLAYRPDVFHRAVDLTRPGGARFLYNLSFKLAGHDWIGYENAQPTSTVGRFVRFVESCTPRQLALFGVPEPGHAYWTAETLRLMGERYPGLDLTPWADALARPSV